MKRDTRVASPGPMYLFLIDARIVLVYNDERRFMMHCCVCTGMCMHTGGPYYCNTHQPKNYLYNGFDQSYKEIKMSNRHDHHECEHEIAYCKVCDECYCTKCDKTWPTTRIVYKEKISSYWPSQIRYDTTQANFIDAISRHNHTP